MIRNNNVPTVAVLMSTFNGEKFLEEQIDSILNQKNVNVKLFIRDDGSYDNTSDIIMRYNKLRRVHIALNGKNLGPGGSFMKLLYKVAGHFAYDYVAFADQDDIWLPDKLDRAVKCLQDFCDVPALYGSNQTIYQNGGQRGLRFIKNPDVSLLHHVHRNEVSGCTMVMNAKLVDQIVSHPCPPSYIIDFRIHDAWVFLVALLTGKVVYDESSRILYRIHENNTVGLKGVSVKERFFRMLKVGNNKKRRANIRSNTAGVLLEYYPDASGTDRKILEELAYYRKSPAMKWKLLHDDELIKASAECPLVFRLKVILNFV